MIDKLVNKNLYNKLASQFNLSQIEEIRIRANCPVVVCVKSRNYVLKGDIKQYYVATDEDINYTLAVATQNSLYAVNDQIKQMYISFDGGVRIGITGDIVTNNGVVSTVKYINSINIRIPHQVTNFSNIAMDYIYNHGKVASTLVVSEPGAGKTTLLRDICHNLSLQNTINNVLLVDERYEIANSINGRPTLNVGIFTDVISGGNKLHAFSFGIRALKPNVIVTDELASESDYEACRRAVESGVAVIASMHAKNQYELVKNIYAKKLLADGVFQRIIVLSEMSPNRYQGIYDNNLRCLYMPC